MAQVDPNFWKTKRVFLTGHTGFKGSWMALWLQHMGADVAGYALAPPTNPAVFDLAHVAASMDHQIADVRNLDTLSKALGAHQPDVVIHMAAQALVRDSYEHPVDTYATNVMGTVNLLESCRRADSVRTVIIVTSDKCYENREHMAGYTEADAMGGYDPYSSSKGAAEIVTAAYRQSYFNPTDWDNHGVGVASARAGNVIGGGDWSKDRLVPDLIRSFIAGEKTVIRYPGAIRPWQHVLEPVAGYLILAQRLHEEGAPFAEAWNFGPGSDSEKPVQHIADTLSALWSNEAGWTLDQGDFPHEATFLKLDCSKAIEQLGWHPRLVLDDSLAMTVDWYQAYAAQKDLKAFTLDQIENFSGALPL
jgi:CDP-glucose 4,6-dehydratase